ncbi:DUF4126 domain-containing protein [Aerosakkonemataceae cyanobacterium BLCC-F154]|uniref:DUF4126 domain-containing protein n=1 Tax=Floridaenema fluviatile BLCC-F154 TaxID=3153640 RepID=A0ABV4YGQ2_9CYAN
MDILLGICLGISLSAACGFRVFVPPLAMSIAALSGVWTPASGFEWIGSYEALVAFSIATLIEVTAYYIPWLDHFLDALVTPVAVATGTIITASMFTHFDPVLQWSVAAIAGGGSAAIVEVITNITRLFSTTTTGGLGNSVFATFETVTSIVLSILGILLPIFTAILLAIFLGVAVSKIWQMREVKQQSVTTE